MIFTNPLYKLAAYAAVAIGFVAIAWFVVHKIEQRGYNKAVFVYTAQIDGIKREAAAKLASETARVQATEQALQAAKQKQETKDYKNAKTIAGLSDKLRDLAWPTGRLYDPSAPGCGAGCGSAPSQAAATADYSLRNPAQAGGLLSKNLSGLLQQLSREADDINAAYISCRADAYAVRGEP